LGRRLNQSVMETEVAQKCACTEYLRNGRSKTSVNGAVRAYAKAFSEPAPAPRGPGPTHPPDASRAREGPQRAFAGIAPCSPALPKPLNSRAPWGNFPHPGIMSLPVPGPHPSARCFTRARGAAACFCRHRPACSPALPKPLNSRAPWGNFPHPGIMSLPVPGGSPGR
jgi:hypothetical protein